MIVGRSHWLILLVEAAPIAALRRHKAAGDRVCTRSVSGGPKRQRKMAEADYFASRCRAPPARREIVGGGHCGPGPPAAPVASQGRPWAWLFETERRDRATDFTTATTRDGHAAGRQLASIEKRATSSGAGCQRSARRRPSIPSARRSPLKSSVRGDRINGSIPLARARPLSNAAARSRAVGVARDVEASELD